MRVKIYSRVWRIMNVPDDDMDNDWGDCTSSDHLIRINEQIKNRRRLDTIVHELTHAIFPNLAHKKVYEIARIVSEVLWKDGWRKNK